MTELRYYQSASIDAIFDYWSSGGGNPLSDLATGTGKSVVIAAFMRRMIEGWPNTRILVLVHVRELVDQNAKALLRYWPGAPIGINSAGLGRRDTRSQILFASIQSVFRKPAQLGPRDLVIVDEAHMISNEGSGMYLRLFEGLRDMVPDMRIVGFTATPYRLGSGRLDKGNGRIFDDTVYSYGIGQGVADGYLAPLISKATLTGIDVSGVTKRGGEFVEGALAAAVDQDEITESACDEIVAMGVDRRSWLVFCTGVKHAHNIRDAIRRRGIACETVTGDTPAGERDRIISAFRGGRLQCLTNAMVLTTGFDAPGVDLLAMLRPTLSTGLYVQVLGRGTRCIGANIQESVANGKANCLVLDFAGNVRRHGPVDTIKIGTKKAKDDDEFAVKEDSIRAKACPECQTYVALNVFVCSTCGHEWERLEPSKPKHDPKADAESQIMSAGVFKDPWIPVRSISFSRHTKRFEPDAPPTLRVDYSCGLTIHSEWVCFEHTGYARTKAEKWWKDMGGHDPYPWNVVEAATRAQDGELAQPSDIVIKEEGKFVRVLGRRFSNAERQRAAGHVVKAFRPPQPLEDERAHWSTIFGVSRAATFDEVKVRFRGLAKTHHPDCGGSHSIMANLNRALNDAELDLCSEDIPF